MKKAFRHLLAAMLVLAISACGKEPATEDNPTPDNPSSGTPVTPTPDPEPDPEPTTPALQSGPAGVTYQILVYSFADSDGDGCGDFKGIEQHLDYLAELGASALWLSPIHPASSYHGYDVLDYADVNPDYGSMEDFKSLLSAAHAKGIKIYLDFVLNHTSSQHEWFREAKSMESSMYRSFYTFSKDPKADIAAGKIAMIASEGAAGYDAGQWYSAASDAGAKGMLKFHLDWTNASAPTITVTQAEGPADSPNTDSSVQKYLYFTRYDNTEECLRFHQTSTDIYDLTVDFESDWGFLIRTSNTSWSTGTKYGVADNSQIVVYGEPLTLKASSSNFDPVNIQFTSPLLYHDCMAGGAFADLDYGKVGEWESNSTFTTITGIVDDWIRMGVDGLRLDAVKHIYHNPTSDENPRFLKAFYDHCNATYKACGGKGDFYTVGEVLDDQARVAPYYAGLPALFDFSFWWTLKDDINNGKAYDFVSTIKGFQKKYESYNPDYVHPIKLSNHDEERTGTSLNKSAAKEKLAAAVLLTFGKDPYVYQGEELGYWGKQASGDEYVRAPIRWTRTGGIADAKLGGKTDSSMLTADRSVEGEKDDDTSVLNAYLKLAALRYTYPALQNGTTDSHATYNASNTSYKSIAAWYRTTSSQKMLVVHNFSNKAETLEFSDDLSNLAGSIGSVKVDGNTLTINGYASAVFEIK